MANKKTKLTLTGIAKKSIQNIELAKTQSKNTVVIEKKTNRFASNNPVRKSAGFKSKFKQNPIEQIRKDLEHLLQIRTKEDDTIIDALRQRESLVPSDKASI